jgi:hypothetical protein
MKNVYFPSVEKMVSAAIDSRLPVADRCIHTNCVHGVRMACAVRGSDGAVNGFLIYCEDCYSQASIIEKGR